VTQPEFAAFGIRGAGTLYEINFRQPIVRSRFDEFALSLGYAYQTGQTFLFNDLQTPFGIGPEPDGSTRTGVIKFAQDYTVWEPNNSAWYFRSQFNLGTGLGIFNVSSNKTNNPDAPTSYFLSWNAQIQRLQSLEKNIFLLASLDTQLASDPLLPSQQFAIGGAQSVRGFRQNARIGDNGVRLSLENRWILLRDEIDQSAKLQFGPFVDLGVVWNHFRNPNQLPQQNLISGGGLVAIFEPIKGLTMRLDYAIPFLQLSDKTSNLQDSSLYFNMKYQF
jgi:hemolysin activation/secretion protein